MSPPAVGAFRLECSACASAPEDVRLATTCPECGKPLFAHYGTPPGDLPGRWRASHRQDMWRYRELLPLREDEEPVTIGEGGTPLLPVERPGAELEGLRLYVKDEGQNPTGSFKDRGLAAAVTRAALDGASALVIPSAGNAGAALSAYAARAGLPARVFIPRDTPAGVERRCRHYGAELVKVDGLIGDCGRLAAEHAAETGAFDVSTLREPYRVEGKKTMMLEILEALDWRPPDAFVYPTGGGTGLIASWKVLGELADAGILSPTTRCYAVQAAGCAPIVRAWEEGRAEAVVWEEPRTAAWGLRVPGALGDFLILRALRESGGGAVAVGEQEMANGAAELGRRAAVGASIEGGATWAGAVELRRRGELRDGETVVLFNTGNLLTY